MCRTIKSHGKTSILSIVVIAIGLMAGCSPKEASQPAVAEEPAVLPDSDSEGSAAEEPDIGIDEPASDEDAHIGGSMLKYPETTVDGAFVPAYNRWYMEWFFGPYNGMSIPPDGEITSIEWESVDRFTCSWKAYDGTEPYWAEGSKEVYLGDTRFKEWAARKYGLEEDWVYHKEDYTNWN